MCSWSPRSRMGGSPGLSLLGSPREQEPWGQKAGPEERFGFARAKGSCHSCKRGSPLHPERFYFETKHLSCAFSAWVDSMSVEAPCGWAGGLYGVPSHLGKGSLCDLYFASPQAFCSLLHCSGSIAESDVNRFVVVKCFMGQLSFSCTFPLFPPRFSSKRKWACRVLFVRAWEVSWPRSLSLPAWAGSTLGNNVVYLCHRWFFHPWSVDDTVCICWLWPGFIPPHTDTQLWCSPLGPRGCAQESCCPQGGSHFPPVSFGPPVPCQPQVLPSSPVAQLGSAHWTPSPVLAAVFPGWRDSSGNRVCFYCKTIICKTIIHHFGKLYLEQRRDKAPNQAYHMSGCLMSVLQQLAQDYSPSGKISAVFGGWLWDAEMLQDLWPCYLWLAGFWLKSYLEANTSALWTPWNPPLKLVRSVWFKKGFGVACLEADILQVL